MSYAFTALESRLRFGGNRHILSEDVTSEAIARRCGFQEAKGKVEQEKQAWGTKLLEEAGLEPMDFVRQEGGQLLWS